MLPAGFCETELIAPPISLAWVAVAVANVLIPSNFACTRWVNVSGPGIGGGLGGGSNGNGAGGCGGSCGQGG